ncbi:MAG: hypothetical protein VX642_13600, partial [Bdellovibrionota bacterium]|nr:hypothetical protein [Bdellovibrionota bacterium]
EKDSFKFSIDEKTRVDLDYERIIKPNLVEMAITTWGRARLDYMLKNPLLDPVQIKKRQEMILKFSQNPELLGQIRNNLEQIKEANLEIADIQKISLNKKILGLYKGIAYAPILALFVSAVDTSISLFSLGIMQAYMANSIKIPEITLLKSHGNNIKKLLSEMNSEFQGLDSWDTIQESFREDSYFETNILSYKSKLVSFFDPTGLLRTFKSFERDFDKNFDQTVRSLSTLAELDVLVSMADFYAKNSDKLVFPAVIESSRPVLSITNGHHPYLRFSSDQFSRENSINLSLDLNDHANMKIITGPNTGGKSTYLRMIGILSLMAQSGFPVPAEAMTISPMRLVSNFKEGDRTEDGKSTFESQADRISEVLHHVNSFGGHKLVLMDEILTGTSGLEQRAAEVATVEALAMNKNTLSITITHDRKLAELAKFYPEIVNFQVMLGSHDIVSGQSTTHNALEVLDARGVPKELTERARALLKFYQEQEERNSYPIVPPGR